MAEFSQYGKKINQNTKLGLPSSSSFALSSVFAAALFLRKNENRLVVSAEGLLTSGVFPFLSSVSEKCL